MTDATRPAPRPETAFFAHSLDGRPTAQWQLLPDHSQAVARLAREFAAAFAQAGVAELAEASGLLHDLGKYTLAYQARIRGEGGRVDHATWGAIVAIQRWGGLGQLIAYAIAGHHAGLANGAGFEGARTALQERLKADLPELLDAWTTELAPPRQLPAPTGLQPRSKAHQQFTLSFLVRMLFSCLVDADFLDTEAFYAGAEGRPVPRGHTVGIAELQAAVSAHRVQTAARVPQGGINTERSRILAHVRGQAGLAPGLFSLTVPTGGGKTLTSLAFGLDHALAHGLRRLIYVIPYTSIVEQNAQVFRDALRSLGPAGEAAVLEHHSAFADDPGKALEARDKTRLAMENWDAPLIVTTAVQFFESLFGARPSQCRKLHRIAGSVIVLDEAQTLPLGLLRPTLLALDELARNYRCSIVFCTATQPALADTRFADVIGPQRELAPDPPALFRALRRVTTRHVGALDDAQIVERLLQRTQGLCIVNNRLHARALYQRLQPHGGAWHLSTLMCARHRSAILRQVRGALKAGQPCRLVSTSLIEAGVDISFPRVMRADAGLDSIAQAAGRCNREGLWAAADSEVQVFTPHLDDWKPPPALEQFAAAAQTVLRVHADDPLSPAAIEAYFGELYWAKGDAALDEKNLLGRLRDAHVLSLPFEDIARLYTIMDTAMDSVVIPFDDTAEKALRDLAHASGAKGIARALQPYTVQVPRKAYQALCNSRAVKPATGPWGDQFMVLIDRDLYSQDFGLFWEDPSFIESAKLVW